MFIREYVHGFLDLCFPVVCVECGAVVSTARSDLPLCERCENDLPVLEGTVCWTCARPMGEQHPPETSSPSAIVCGDCRTQDLELEMVLAGFHYRGVMRTVIHDWKFSAHPEWSSWLGEQLYQQIEDRLDGDWDLLIPIPLYHEKETSRGFNQSRRLAQSLSKQTGLPVDESTKKTVPSKPQARLSREERLENLDDVFELAPDHRLSGKSVLIVDDIYTTGSTMNTVARKLKRGGVERMGALILARAE